MATSADLSASTHLAGRNEAGELLYELMVFPFPRGHFRVLSFTGEEALSALYHFDIRVIIPHGGAALVEQLALGQRAAFILRAGPVPRVVRGLIGGIQLIANHPNNGSTQYRLRLVPKLWLLKFKRNTRIFQNLSVHAIVDAVLHEAGIKARWFLQHEHPTRNYCTQYEETDLEFVQRLLAEAGIYYHFAEPAKLALEAISEIDLAPGSAAGTVATAALSTLGAGIVDAIFGADTLIMSDASVAYPPLDNGNILGDVAEFLGVQQQVELSAGPITVSAGLPAPPLHFLSVLGTTVTSHDKITRFELARRIRNTSANYREYDPERPDAGLSASTGMFKPGQDGLGLEVALDAGVSIGSEGVSAQFDTAPAGFAAAAMSALGVWPQLEHYEHHGPFLFPDWDYGRDEPKRLMRQLRRRAVTTEGDSRVQVMQAGHRFKLEDHPVDRLNRGYACIKVNHEGWAIDHEQRPIYQNSFECVPDDVTFCAPRPERRSVMVTLTATVVGPASEEIYTDALGRIKVQFHWDRLGGRNEYSSCWIRTMQTWGGPGWGSQFIPRIGMEVVVTFLGGDPDKPMVLGSVYNGTHPPSFMLPGNKTRSGFRTQSSPHAQGFNELSFEDQAGQEQIYLKAQRDLDERVLHDHTLRVDNDETLHIGGNRKDNIEKDVITHIGQNLKETVMADHESAVIGSRLDTVTGDKDERVSGTLTSRAEGREIRDVSKDANHNYHADHTVKVTGNLTTIVGRHEAPRAYGLHVEGAASIHCTEVLQLSSDKEVLISVGKSSIRISDGRIEINAPAVAAAGEASNMSLDDGGLKLKSKGAITRMTDAGLVTETEKGASFSMGQEIKADAPKILLNSPDLADDEPFPPREPLTKIALSDEQGQPLANQRYVIVLADGSERSGALDKDGKAEVLLPDDGEIFFPDLTDVAAG